MALDVDTDAVRQASEFVSNAAQCLHPDLGTDVPACGSDDVSQTVMNNLNARRRWLLDHVRSGAAQASTAAAGITDTAQGFEAQDAAGAAGYGGGGSGATPGPGAPSAASSGSSAPPGMPTFSPIPDISGADGETVARQLETGPGAGPAVTAASHLTALSTRAHAATTSLTMARGSIVASGQSQAHPGLLRRLDQAIVWSAGVAGHADALAAGYGAAGALHTTTTTAVGPSAGWRMLKDSYRDAVMESRMLGGLSQGKVDALQAALTTKEAQKGVAMGGYQVGGSTVSTPPGDLPDPGLDPHGDGGLPGTPSKGDKATNSSGSQDGQGGGGLQDMLGPLLGALGPLTQSLGKANPLSSLGQAAQMVSKLGGDAAKKAASPLKPAALAKPTPLGGKGAGKGGGGGSPIKPSSPLAGVRAAALSGSPPSSAPSAASVTPGGAGAARAAGPGAGGGMGMMPMGHKPGGDEKAERVHGYGEDPLPDVEQVGRPGVDGEVAAAAAPLVDPKASNAVKERLERRKREATADGSS